MLPHAQFLSSGVKRPAVDAEIDQVVMADMQSCDGHLELLLFQLLHDDRLPAQLQQDTRAACGLDLQNACTVEAGTMPVA